MEPPNFLEWPGKRDREGRTHPAAWHMLDVGSVAVHLLDQGPLCHFAPATRQAFGLLIVLHDLGKFSSAFRKQIETLNSPPEESYRHWRLSDVMLLKLDPLMAKLLGGSEVVRENLYGAVAGHHGGPPERLTGRPLRRQVEQIGAEGFAAASSFIEAVAPLFPAASLAAITEAESRLVSWLLSGVTVQADWIGSNTNWFGFRSDSIPLTEYWQSNADLAARAIRAAGLSRSQVNVGLTPSALVGFDQLRPMQGVCAEEPLPKGPCVALIEDSMGTGKTEAALILAHRMIAAGKGRGIYFALPTTATADSMFARLRPMIGKIFQGHPSLSLAHGRRMLSESFSEVKGNDGHRPQDAACAAWLADDRRLSLLAEIGVGTIDQALLGVLPTRFNSLRLAALADRILVVDEAHSYDPYMERELCSLLEFQAALGGSAIVMTATLPPSMREGYARAFQSGLGVTSAPSPLATEYPAFSMVSKKVSSDGVSHLPTLERTVRVNRLTSDEEAAGIIRAGVEAGAACVWIRNAVDDAISAVHLLRNMDIKADLLHARFAMGDRLAIEDRVIDRYGKEGRNRARGVLVATQIVESSLDLDFDVMVSDLAPVGALLQRSGRLWRHMDKRPKAERPVDGPCLHILSPDPDAVENGRWLHSALPSGAYVYPQDIQWRTAQVMFSAGTFKVPHDLRYLIGRVHGADIVDLPEPLKHAELQTEGRDAAQAALAHQNVLRASNGYLLDHAHDDQIYPTRLGEPQITLVLARATPDGLKTLVEHSVPTKALALSEVQLSLKRYRRLVNPPDQDRADVKQFTASWKQWERNTKVVAVVNEDGSIVSDLNYDSRLGLMIGNV